MSKNSNNLNNNNNFDSGSETLLQKRLREYYNDDEDQEDDEDEMDFQFMGNKYKNSKDKNNPFDADIVKPTEKEKKLKAKEKKLTQILLQKCVDAERKLKNNEELTNEEVLLLFRRNFPLFSENTKKLIYTDRVRLSIFNALGFTYTIMIGSFVYYSLLFFDRANKKKIRNFSASLISMSLCYMQYDRLINTAKAQYFGKYVKQYKNDILNPDNYIKKAPFVDLKKDDSPWDIKKLFK
jgi:hypothetical protein